MMSCSALKSSYRAILRSGDENFLLVYLDVSRSVVQERIAKRRDHFMPSALMHSQFDDLEEPDQREHHIRLKAYSSIENALTLIETQLRTLDM